MTNEKVLIAGIKTLNSFDVALLRERILAICDMTLKAIDEKPEQFDAGLVTARQMKLSMTNIKNAFDFKEEKQQTEKKKESKAHT
jgi:hypothetical protein